MSGCPPAEAKSRRCTSCQPGRLPWAGSTSSPPFAKARGISEVSAGARKNGGWLVGGACERGGVGANRTTTWVAYVGVP